MADLQLKLELEGQDATLETLYTLQAWIQQDQILGLKQIEPEANPTQPGQMGGNQKSALSIVLSSAAVTILAQSLHVWIEATRPEVTVKIQLNEEQSIELTSKNMPNQEELITEFTKKLKELESVE